MPTTRQSIDEIVRGFGELKTPAEKALMARIARFFVDTIKDLTTADKTAALQARDDILVVVETIARRPVEGSPEYSVRLRGALQKQRMLEAEGGVIGPKEAGRLLGISRQAVGQRRAAGKLLGVPVAGGFAYPVWQFEDAATLRGLEEVLSALGDEDPWMKIAFFLNGNAALERRRPLDALRRGELKKVLRAARIHLQQGG